MFLLHREQCFFLLPRKQSVSFIQGTVFLSLAKTAKCFFCIGKVFLSFAVTTKCFFYTGNSVSFFCQDNKERNTVPCAQETQCFFLLPRQQVFLVYRKQCFFLQPRQQSVSFAQGTVFLSSAETTKCFFCTGNSVSFFCRDNKVFLLHREQCFFLLPRKQSVSFIQGTVFLSLAKTTKCFFCTGNSVSFAMTTKCFFCTGNSVSFFCQDNKVFLVSLILLYSL